jgi:hypothetical protein
MKLWINQMKIKSVKVVFRKYSYFFTINLATPLICIFLFIFKVGGGSWSLDKGIQTLLITVILVLIVSLITILPFDIYRYKKDKKMCDSVGIDYDEFVMLDELEKEEARKRID